MTFTPDELESIQRIYGASEFGPTQAFRAWFQVDPATPLVTAQVEDFAIAFMSQYNALYPETY